MKATNPAFADFIAYVSRVVAPLSLSDAAVAQLARASELRVFTAKEHVWRAGDIADHLFFVHKGLIRTFYVDQTSGDETTQQFFGAGGLCADVMSFVARQASRQHIQAVEDSKIVCIPITGVVQTYDTDHALERFGRLMAQIGSRTCYLAARDPIRVSQSPPARH
jgi:signal-transduction protein with cAMP-binding, CBS, and nucleotidyltransferase domain